MGLDKVRFWASKVVLKGCTFTQTPEIEARVLETQNSLKSVDSIICRELQRTATERIPNMEKKLNVTGVQNQVVDLSTGYDNLKALSVRYHMEGSLFFEPLTKLRQLVIPKSVEKLEFVSKVEWEVDVEPGQLKWLKWCSQHTGDLASKVMLDLAQRVGPYLACRLDMLRMKRPPSPSKCR